MPDEERFDRALKLAGDFFNIRLRVFIAHPKIPNVEIEVDNIAQKSKTVFIFEGKSKKEESAITQLNLSCQSFMLFRKRYIKSKLVAPYTSIRLFYYSFKRHILAEFTPQGKGISRLKFKDINELAGLLRKL